MDAYAMKSLERLGKNSYRASSSAKSGLQLLRLYFNGFLSLGSYSCFGLINVLFFFLLNFILSCCSSTAIFDSVGCGFAERAVDSFGSLRRHQLQEALCADPFVATLGSVQTRIEVEADGALDGALVIVGVEARREVAGADEAAEVAGVQVGELPDQALWPRQPLLHRRPGS